MIAQPSLNIAQQSNKTIEQLKIEMDIEEIEKKVIDQKIMSLNAFLKYKKDFDKVLLNYFEKQKSTQKIQQSSHIFDPHFWTSEFRAWFAAASLHIWMSSNAIEQLTEAISNGFTALAFIAGLNVTIPGAGIAVAIYMIANMAVWRHIDQGKGVVSRYLFMVIPTGYWAEE